MLRSIAFCTAWIVAISLAGYTVAAQPTLTSERQRVIMIKQVSNNGSGLRMDSISFSYSGNRGSRFNALDFEFTRQYGYFNYDYASYYLPYNYNTSSFSPVADMPEPFKDVKDRNVLYDTMKLYKALFDSAWHIPELQQTTSVQYRHTLATAICNTDDGYGSYCFYYEYDLNDRLSRIYSIYFGQQRADTSVSRNIVYDIDNRVLEDTYTDPANEIVYTHEYDNEGRISKIFRYAYRNHNSIANEMRGMVFRYNKGNFPDTALTINKNASGFDTAITWTIHYDAEKRISAFVGNFSIKLALIPHYNRWNDIDTLTRTHSDYSGNITHRITHVFYYNTFHNPDSVLTFYSDISPAPVVARTYYQYETYFADTLANRQEVVLFPNPAHGQIYLKWNKIFDSVPADIDIYNSIGQLVRKSRIEKPGYIDAINISDYAPGVYFLRIVNANGKQLYIGRFVIDQ